MVAPSGLAVGQPVVSGSPVITQSTLTLDAGRLMSPPPTVGVPVEASQSHAIDGGRGVSAPSAAASHSTRSVAGDVSDGAAVECRASE